MNQGENPEEDCLIYTQKLQENPNSVEVVSGLATALHTKPMAWVDPRVSLINIDVNKAVSNLKVVEEESNKLKEKEEKKRELETLYETSNERNLSSELHQGRRRSSSQSERKLSLKSAMNATEKALTYNSKYNRHRRNSSKIYQRKSTHKKAYSRSIGYVSSKH